MDFEKLIDLHFGTLLNYKAASIKYYLETGTVSGTFRSELKAMLKEACEGKADQTSEKDLRVCDVIPRFFDPERNKPLPSKNDITLSDDVFIIDEDGMHGLAYYSFEDCQWKFHTDTLVDYNEVGHETKWKWYYPTVTVKDAF